MKGTLKSVAAALMMLAVSGVHAHAFYQAFNGNPDLYTGDSSSLKLPTSSHAGDHNSDIGILDVDSLTFCLVLAQMGSSDDYGSSLLDVGHQIHW